MVPVWIKKMIVTGLACLLFAGCPPNVQAEATQEIGFSFESIITTIADSLWEEFVLLKESIAPILIFMILIGIKNCMEFPISLNRTVHLGVFCALALCSGELFRELASVAEECIRNLSEFVYLTIPTLTALIANGGRVLSAAKSTYFILGFMSLLVYLIQNIFFPGILIYFMCAILSPLLEKDYFSALKKSILWAVKTALPIIIGIFMMVFTLLTTVTKASDSFTLQSAKMALGTCIPFLGGTLSDSGEYLIEAISQIKAKAGLTGAIGISYLLLSPLVKLTAGLLTFQGLSVCSGFLSDQKTTHFLEDTATGLGMLTGVVATVSVIAILGIMILMGI